MAVKPALVGPLLQPQIEHSRLSTEGLLDRCKAIAAAKAHDYTTSGSLTGVGRHENFERAAALASWFPAAIDKPYVVLIGVKLARLAALLDAKTPNNESIEDTFVDLTNYCALWGSRRLEP
jgi:hypothetical protein